jgi:hypothetical protein
VHRAGIGSAGGLKCAVRYVCCTGVACVRSLACSGRVSACKTAMVLHPSQVFSRHVWEAPALAAMIGVPRVLVW